MGAIKERPDESGLLVTAEDSTTGLRYMIYEVRPNVFQRKMRYVVDVLRRIQHVLPVNRVELIRHGIHLPMTWEPDVPGVRKLLCPSFISLGIILPVSIGLAPGREVDDFKYWYRVLCDLFSVSQGQLDLAWRDTISQYKILHQSIDLTEGSVSF
jgi:hypothetical protein